MNIIEKAFNYYNRGCITVEELASELQFQILAYMECGMIGLATADSCLTAINKWRYEGYDIDYLKEKLECVYRKTYFLCFELADDLIHFCKENKLEWIAEHNPPENVKVTVKGANVKQLRQIEELLNV